MARISKRIGSISESATLKVDAKAKALQAEGRPVISYRRRRARLRDARAHRRGGASPPPRDPKNYRYTPAAGLPELREAIAAKTLRDSGLEVDPGQVIVTNGGKQAVYQAFRRCSTRATRCSLPDALLDHLPRGDQARRRRARRGVRRRRPGLPGHGRPARGRPHRRARKVLLFVSPSNPTGAVYAARADAGHRPSGPSSTASGSSPTRSTRTSPTTAHARRVSIVEARARARRPAPSWSTASRRPTP